MNLRNWSKIMNVIRNPSRREAEAIKKDVRLLNDQSDEKQRDMGLFITRSAREGLKTNCLLTISQLDHNLL